MKLSKEDRILGCLLGTAVGDAIGLPLENLSQRRISRFLGDAPLNHRFLFGCGMVSDDTEHSCLVAQALLVSGLGPDAFGRDLAKRLRWWLAGLPAGTGRATARACLKLWLGASFQSSGVFSAGNGPAMRAAIIGAAVQDQQLAVELTTIGSQITHSDPKALYGALAVAAVAHLAASDPKPDQALAGDRVRAACAQWIKADDEPAREFLQLIDGAAASAMRGDSTCQYAAENSMGNGVSGYTYHTVPAALHACMRYRGQYEQMIEELIRCGGDVDSTAAIAGGIVGTAIGPNALPERWLAGLIEWPRTKRWMGGLAVDVAQLESGQPRTAPKINPLIQLLRNLFFLLVVLIHALRRLLPPW